MFSEVTTEQLQGGIITLLIHAKSVGRRALEMRDMMWFLEKSIPVLGCEILASSQEIRAVVDEMKALHTIDEWPMGISLPRPRDDAFKNPDGLFPEYVGEYTVELMLATSTEKVPEETVGVDKSGSTILISVANGRVIKEDNVLQFYDQRASPFSWAHSDIIAVRDGEGFPLWMNSSFRFRTT